MWSVEPQRRGSRLANEPTAAVEAWHEATAKRCKSIQAFQTKCSRRRTCPSDSFGFDTQIALVGDLETLAASCMSTHLAPEVTTPHDHTQLPWPCPFMSGVDASKLPASASTVTTSLTSAETSSSAPSSTSSRFSGFPFLPGSQDTFTVAGETPGLLLVQQEEYGFAVSSPQSSRRTFVASSDATSCVVVAVRGVLHQRQQREDTGSSAVATSCAMVHLDHGGVDLLQVLDDMVLRQLIPSLLVLGREARHEPATASDSATLEWYIVGGMHRDRYTVPTLADVAYYVACCLPESVTLSCDGQHVLQLSHRLRVDGLCFSAFNTTAMSMRGINTTSALISMHDAGPVLRCCVWGVIIDVETGDSAPCMVDPSRRYFAASLRDTACCGAYHSISAMSDRPCAFTTHTSHNTVANILRWKVATEPESSPVIVSLSFEEFVLGLQQRCGAVPVPIVVGACSWTPRVLLSEQEALRNSTTPHCEPPDFASVWRRQRVFTRTVTPEDVFPHGVAVSNW